MYGYILEKSCTRFCAVRYIFAIIVLIFIVGFSPIFTVYHNSVQTNNFIAQLQLLFFVLLARETVREIVLFFSERRNIGAMFFILAFSFLVIFSYFFVSASVRSG